MFSYPVRRSSSTASATPFQTIIARASDLLPHQPILENFVHHNPLRHLESLPFRQALDHVHSLESYMSPGERTFALLNVDPRKRVNEALSSLSAAFLDRGASKWTPRFRNRGFLYFFASLESLGVAPWRRQARETARHVLAQMGPENVELDSAASTQLAEDIIRENLEFFGIPPEDWENALRSMMMEQRGWAGMFQRMETHPSEAPSDATVRLLDYVAVSSILSRASTETLARHHGWDPASLPFHVWLSKAPKLRGPEDAPPPHASAIAYIDQDPNLREALEAKFQRALLGAIMNNTSQHSAPKPDKTQLAEATLGQPAPLPVPVQRPSLQLYTCIDDRECSLRRHVEQLEPSGAVETFGVAGFFGIPITYKPVDGRDVMVLAPEGAAPVATLVEREDKAHHGEVPRYISHRKWFARSALAWENLSFSPLGSLALSAFFPVSLSRLWLMGYNPLLKQSIRDTVLNTALPKPHTDFQLPLPPETAAAMLARTFKDIGTHQRFAPFVLVLGHGAVSVNNPYAAAYNCGACCGREGGPNARLLARLANESAVRDCLRRDHNVDIPSDTVFIGGLHNTTTDTIELFDLDKLPQSHTGEKLDRIKELLDHARGNNALERCNRFMLAREIHTKEQALQHVRSRAVDAAEVRPELNHASNSGVVVGRRELTHGQFLDRRVFLPSYDPYADDAAGTNLEHVLGPALTVCSGINLEYLFSTIDAEHHGAGSKAPLNVVSNIGVMQGTAGDLRTGLPSQMTEMHTPVRALVVVDAPVQRVMAVLSRREDLRQLVHNEWVRFFVRDPGSGVFYQQSQGQFAPVDVSTSSDSKELEAPFQHHRTHGLAVARQESRIYAAATAGMLASCVGPIMLFGSQSMLPYGSLVAGSATLLALPVLAFSRRYLHGEFMFARFATLSVGLLLGFNLVATAPTLLHAMSGWGLFGFASTFLIGSYNDRPTVRNNATFAFTAYRLSDFALLLSCSFLPAAGAAVSTTPLVAAGLLIAALLKSSQFPLTALFVRSMEGPTPASALGYAGLSAHVGVVLLASTMPLWFEFDWARLALGGIGLYTAIVNTGMAKIRADRKGAIARATSATLGGIFVTLALGFPKTALVASLGHAAFRMIQVLRSPNVIADLQSLRAGLGFTPWPKRVPDWLYRAAWVLKRVDMDLHVLNVIQSVTGRLRLPSMQLSKWQQWGLTAAVVVIAGAPFTPLSHLLEEELMQLLPTHPVLAGCIMLGHLGLSIVVIRSLFVNVLNPKRFRRTFNLPPYSGNKRPETILPSQHRSDW